jgi:C-terminal processing protease CtpA/Prc
MRAKYLAFTLVLVASVAATASAQSLPIGLERNRGRTMLNAIKSDLKKNYYDASFRGIDVEARFKQAEERIAKASHQNEIFGVIAETLVDLNDSHTYFVPPRRSYTFEYGWKMQMIGEKCYVTSVKPGSDAEAKGLKEGDEIYTIDSLGPIRDNLWKIYYLYYALAPRTVIRLNVIKPDGRQQELEVKTKVVQHKSVMDLGTGDLWDLMREAEAEDRLNRHRFYEAGNDLLIWKMSEFDLEAQKVDSNVGRAKKRKALDTRSAR